MKNLTTLLFLLPLLLTGCAGNGYISSTIHTVVGLDVSENPKTQVPHVRFGYVRSGLYYVPTGKSPGPKGSVDTGQSVKDTPELVSEIFVNAKFLSSVTINEKFAIGAEAVKSSAASRAFASTAAQQVAQGSGGGEAPIQHVDEPAVERVVHTKERILEKAPPEPSLDAEKVKDVLQGRLTTVGTVTADQWGKLVPGKTTLGDVMNHATDLANKSATEGDPTQRAKALKDLSDLNEKSKKPPAEW